MNKPDPHTLIQPTREQLRRNKGDGPDVLTADELAGLRAELDANAETTMYGREWLDDLLATIAADKARIAELQAEATRQAGVYERYLQEMVALYDAKLERARTWVDYHGDSAQWLADESDDLGDAHEAMTDEYDAEIAAVKVASDE